MCRFSLGNAGVTQDFQGALRRNAVAFPAGVIVVSFGISSTESTFGSTPSRTKSSPGRLPVLAIEARGGLFTRRLIAFRGVARDRKGAEGRRFGTRGGAHATADRTRPRQLSPTQHSDAQLTAGRTRPRPPSHMHHSDAQLTADRTRPRQPSHMHHGDARSAGNPTTMASLAPDRLPLSARRPATTPPFDNLLMSRPPRPAQRNLSSTCSAGRCERPSDPDACRSRGR